jgi:hypothetical protein
VLEPLIAHRHGAVPRRKNDVEEMLPAEHLGEPALVFDLDPVTEITEMLEDARAVGRLAEDVEILGRARDPGVGADRTGPANMNGMPDFDSSRRTSP